MVIMLLRHKEKQCIRTIFLFSSLCIIGRCFVTTDSLSFCIINW